MTATKPILLLPIPLDSPEVWRIFRHHIDRFCSTWRQHPPGDIDLDVVAICQNADPTPELFALFHGLPVRFVRYDGQGADLGCHQWFARTCGGNPFLICCTSRMYFHRAGWGDRLWAARQKHGPALYGLSASYESGKLHLCTRGYCLDAADLRLYPKEISSRDFGVYFECGDGCLLDWFESLPPSSSYTLSYASSPAVQSSEFKVQSSKLVPDAPTLPRSDAQAIHPSNNPPLHQSTNPTRRAYLVYWDGIWEKQDWFNRPDTFRKGTQRNMLMWDKHSDIWAAADPLRRQELDQMAFGTTKHRSQAKDGPLKIAATLPLKVDPEKSLLPEACAQMQAVCDEIIVLHDRPDDPHSLPALACTPREELVVLGGDGVWSDWSNRAMLCVRAAKYGCRWIMQLDDDELLGPSLTRDRLREICHRAERDGYVQVCVKQRVIWESTRDGFAADRWRSDGPFAKLPKTLLLYNPYILQHPEFRYGPEWTLHHFPVLNGPILYVDDPLYHWGLRTRSLREKNAAKYLQADPHHQFTSMRYDHLLDEEGMILEPL